MRISDWSSDVCSSDLGHRHQRERREDRTRKEIGSPPPQSSPGAVTVMADQRLDEQPGDRPRNPEDREIVDRRAQRLEDAADIGALEREPDLDAERSEEHTSELQSLMRISYAVFCLKTKTNTI